MCAISNKNIIGLIFSLFESHLKVNIHKSVVSISHSEKSSINNVYKEKNSLQHVFADLFCGNKNPKDNKTEPVRALLDIRSIRTLIFPDISKK